MVVIVMKDRFVLKVFDIKDEQKAINYVKQQCEIRGYKKHEFDLIYKYIE